MGITDTRKKTYSKKMKLLNLAFLTVFHFTNSLPQYPDRPLIRIYEDDSAHEWSMEEPRFTDDRAAFQNSEEAKRNAGERKKIAEIEGENGIRRRKTRKIAVLTAASASTSSRISPYKPLQRT